MNLQFRQTLSEYQIIIKKNIGYNKCKIHIPYELNPISQADKQCAGKLRARSVYLGDSWFDGGTERVRNVR